MQRFPITNGGLSAQLSQTANETAAQQLTATTGQSTVTGGLDLGKWQTHVAAGIPMLFILVLAFGLAYLLFKGHLGLAGSLSGKIGE